MTAGVQPLSEIFSAAHNQVESRPQASPATKRSPAKTTAPTTTANAKHAPEKASQPQYPTLPQNLNSFSQYNTDSGYHGLERDGNDNDGGDDVVLTQVQPESQASTQPLDSQPWKNETEPDTSPIQEPSTGRRMSESSFHSAREVREATAEPTTIDSNPQKKAGTRHLASQSKQKEPDSSSVPSKPVLEAQTQRSFDKKSAEAEKKPTKKTEQRTEQKQKEAKPGQTRAPKAQPRREPEAEPQSEPERSSPQPEPRSESAEIQKSSPAKTPATQPREPRHEEEEEYDDGGKEDMELDGLDDIGSPSDGSTPERPPIRKSSLTFASLPAREPLKKSLGPRMSRTSHVDIGKVNNSGNPGFLGRQTGGHRTAQAGLDEQAPGDRMDVDDAAGASRESADDETKASKQHNKSSTQRLHEKISMLGKLQPSRPTKSIPSVSGLSSAHVSYPELPTVNKAETKSETANRGSREMPAGETMATDEDEWIKPLNTPQRPNLAKSQTFDVAEKSSRAQDQGLERDTSAAQDQSMDEDRPAKPTESQAGAEMYRKSTTPVHSPPKRPMHQKSASVFNTAGEVSTTPVGSPRNQDAPLSASKWKLQSIMKSAKGLFSSTGSVSSAAKVEASSPDEPREPPAKSSTPTKPEGRKTRGSTEREEKRKQKELEDRQKEEDEEEEEKAREQEKQKAAQLKAAQEKASQEQENERATSVSAPSPKRIPQPQKQPSKEPEPANEASTKSGIPPPASSQQLPQKQNERRPVKPTREPLQKPKPQPVSIRVGSALSRQIPMAPGSNVQESSVPPAPTPASSSKPATVNKKTSNNSLHTVPSNSSFKSSVSSNTQRKAQLASERKKEQEEREARRKEEQKREVERKRAAQQQEEARRQEMRSRAEAERRDRERHERQGSEDPKKAAHMQAIEKRRLENARRLERQGSQQPSEPERPASQASRPASRLGSVQPFNRSVNQPHPNPAKPPKRAMDDEPSNRPAPSKPSTVQPSGETKRRRTEDEHNPPPSVRPTMAPPIRQSNIRKVSSIGSSVPFRKYIPYTDFFRNPKSPLWQATASPRCSTVHNLRHTSLALLFSRPHSLNDLPILWTCPSMPAARFPFQKSSSLVPARLLVAAHRRKPHPDHHPSTPVASISNYRRLPRTVKMKIQIPTCCRCPSGLSPRNWKNSSDSKKAWKSTRSSDPLRPSRWKRTSNRTRGSRSSANGQAVRTGLELIV